MTIKGTFLSYLYQKVLHVGTGSPNLQMNLQDYMYQYSSESSCVHVDGMNMKMK